MADYKHEGFDTYGYVEEIQFKPLNNECKVTYRKPLDIEKENEFDLIENLTNQDNSEQNNLAVPECKCLRK